MITNEIGKTKTIATSLNVITTQKKEEFFEDEELSNEFQTVSSSD